MTWVNKPSVSCPEKQLRLLASVTPQELSPSPASLPGLPVRFLHSPNCRSSPRAARHPSALCLAAQTRLPWLSSVWLFIFSLLHPPLLPDTALSKAVHQGCPEGGREDPRPETAPSHHAFTHHKENSSLSLKFPILESRGYSFSMEKVIPGVKVP